MVNTSPLPQEIKNRLSTRWLGQTVHFYQQLDSTNLTAMELALGDAAEGTAVLAEEQLRGRGRGKRSWHSPAGVGIYCSIILRPRLLPAKAQVLTLMTAVAIVKAIGQETGLYPRIKWPNDILLNDNKVAGILLESKMSSQRIEHAVIGFGINVNHTSADLPAESMFKASSLRVELGDQVERGALIAAIFAEVEGLYGMLQQEEVAMILEEWRHFSATLGKPIRVWQQGKVTEGIAVDINEEGGLVVNAKDESLMVIHAGDVEHLRLAVEVEEGG